jgi:hypothetical protein
LTRLGRPFGHKESGWGREMGHNALDNYLETKPVVTQLASRARPLRRPEPRQQFARLRPSTADSRPTTAGPHGSPPRAGPDRRADGAVAREMAPMCGYQ